MDFFLNDINKLVFFIVLGIFWYVMLVVLFDFFVVY